MMRLLLLVLLLVTAACVGLKADERVPFDDAGIAAQPDGDAGGDPGDGGADDAWAPHGGVSIATVPDHRADAELEITNDQVVVDSVTRLRWKLARSPQALGFVKATQLCEEMRAENASDWRVPSKVELLSLADYTSTRTRSSLPSMFVADLGFWSSDTVVSVDPFPRIWCVFYDGPGAAARPPEAEAIETRCVRGPKLGRATLVRQGNVVRDTSSSLVWEAARSPDTMSVADAAKRCAAISLDGISGFRLPEAKELLSLLDDTLSAAPFDDAILPAPRGGSLMTRTPRRNRSAPTVNSVDFDTGGLDGLTTGHVRCVK